jgi:hypothetical protein
MGIHVIDVNENADGTELVDHLHLCSDLCQRDALEILGAEPEFGAGLQVLPRGGSVSYGAYPGGCETDDDVWCVACGRFLWHGMNCECEDRSKNRDPIPVAEGQLLD